MRRRWKWIGGASVLALALVTVTLRPRRVAGQTVDTSTTVSAPTQDSSYHDPSQPYAQGPHAISYDQLSATDQHDVDRIHQNEDLNQPPASYDAWNAAGAAMGADAQAQIAARRIGLVNTDQDGVVP